MLGQHENIVSDASVQIQPPPRSGILTPASDDDAGCGGKKRKRDGNTMDDFLKDSFLVKPYPSIASTRSRTFQPLLLLPRSKLPLSAIDIASSTKALPQSRLFEAHVKILELEDRMGSQPHILIARLDGTHTLFAVERESRGLYVLFQLGSWINLQQLRAAAVASKDDVPKPSNLTLTNQAPVPIATLESSKYSKRKRLAIEEIQSMVKRPSIGLTTESPTTHLDSQKANLPVEAPSTERQPLEMATVPPPVERNPSQLTAAEITENIRNQYLEALYLSKASLAYFAKGPLSRARAAFHLDYDSTLDMNEYIAFLESVVMSTTLMDKKYRDGVPNCVALVDINDHSGEEVSQIAVKPKKRKSTKKMKLGKNGLYPTEDVLIQKWWKAYDDDAESGAPGNSRAEITKGRISHLRIRETQLQMIVILEILALQPLAPAPEDDGLGLPTTLPTTELASVKNKPFKAKKSDQLTTLIDVHIDRLCIWQSVALESSKAPDVSQIGIESAEPIKSTDNIPRDFCVEVITPFFSARLPERCALINRKLGGPVPVPNSKPSLAKSASLNAPSRPGAATKRPVPAKPREQRTLQRVLSDDRERRSMSSGPNRKIALMRSQTMPSGLIFKKENSEAPSLSSIPVAESQTFGSTRGGMLNSKRFAQREVDMSSMLLPDLNSKAKQKAMVEAQLKEAISALKKPNRELVGKALADEIAEKRSSTSASRARKSKKPVRNPLFGVQITATPKAVRHKDMRSEAQNMSSAKTAHSAESPFVPASSLPSIPQTSHRLSKDVLSGKNLMFSSIQATPTRKSSVPRPTEEKSFGGLPPSSPFHLRRLSAQLFPAVPDSDSAVKTSTAMFESHGIQETPVKRRPESALDFFHPAVPDSSVRITSTTFAPRGIQETPVKKAAATLVGHGHPTLPSYGDGSDKENERRTTQAPVTRKDEIILTREESIYEKLGWDDDNDIDDLA